MFKKLKGKFLLINMVLLTTVFIGIFGTIYFMMAYSLDNEVEMQLWNGMVNQPQQKMSPQDGKMDMSIKIDINAENEVVTVSSKFNTEDLDLASIAKEVMAYTEESGRMKIEGESYAYLKQSFNNGIRIVLVNRSFQQGMLSNLLKIFIFTGGFSLVVLFLISIYFTGRAIKPLEETFIKQKQFIADASHELRTPLTIINTNIALLKENKYDTIESQEKWVNYIESQSGRMSTLINEMLSLANLDASRMSCEMSKIDLSKLLNDTLLVFEVVIFEKGLLLDEKIDENIFVNGDISQIKKLVSILLDNAIKYTNNNGQISVTLEGEKNKVKLKIKNTGEGIGKEHLEKIFERFYRVDSSRDRGTGGYGLGLSIAKSISEEHKGKIYAESIVGKETTFTVELPRI